MDLFRYSISMTYIYNSKEHVIDSSNIKNLIVDYDYDNRNMPILFITASIDKNVVDDMIVNSRTKTIILTVSKYVKDSSITIRQNYIHGEFIYFLSDDLNPTSELDYSTTTKDSKDIYRQITIGLIDKKLIDNNKRLINDIFLNTSLLDIILKHTSHMKMLIEPVRDVKIPRFIIPPLTTISQFIKFTNFYYNLYSTPYRLFYDFDKTYLLSSSGNNIPARGEDINSIIINVNKDNNQNSKVQGMYTDKVNKAYIIELSAADIKCLEDKATDISYNKIIGISSTGKYKTVDINLPNATNAPEKVKITRITNDNLDQLENIKTGILNSSMRLNFVKTELDTSVLTMNRKFIIKNYDKLYNKDGTFILSSKKEIYSKDNDSFILSTIISLKKAITS